jgi:hypothetical protein
MPVRDENVTFVELYADVAVVAVEFDESLDAFRGARTREAAELSAYVDGVIAESVAVFEQHVS